MKYAKKANECGTVYREDMKVLQVQQDKIWEAVRRILERLANIGQDNGHGNYKKIPGAVFLILAIKIKVIHLHFKLIFE